MIDVGKLIPVVTSWPSVSAMNWNLYWLCSEAAGWHVPTECESRVRLSVAQPLGILALKHKRQYVKPMSVKATWGKKSGWWPRLRVAVGRWHPLQPRQHPRPRRVCRLSQRYRSDLLSQHPVPAGLGTCAVLVVDTVLERKWAPAIAHGPVTDRKDSIVRWKQ